MRKSQTFRRKLSRIMKQADKAIPEGVDFAFVFWSTGKPVGPGYSGRADTLDLISALRRAADDIEESYNAANSKQE